MCCKVEGCNQPNYHYNPLITPLLRFHGAIVTLGRQLPKEGKAAEVARRIGYAVASPFAYLALGLIALSGFVLNGIWEKRHGLQGNTSNQKDLGLLATKSLMKTTEPEKGCQILKGAFGKAEWEKTFPVTIEEVPPLPFDINAILEQEDPWEPGKKLKETCLLFLRPKKVILHEKKGDKEITLGFDGVEELAMNAANPDRRTKYIIYSKHRPLMNQVPAGESGWVLMRKEVIPGSRSKSYQEQQQMLKGGFAVPGLLDAVLLNILTFASEGKCLYGDNPLTYTHCQEKCGTYQTVVGGFDPSGLLVGFNDFAFDTFGLSGAWKF